MSTSKPLITTSELATRWNVNVKTLEQWRAKKKGPPCVRIGNKKILYRFKDVLEYEKLNEIQTKSV